MVVVGIWGLPPCEFSASATDPENQSASKIGHARWAVGGWCPCGKRYESVITTSSPEGRAEKARIALHVSVAGPYVAIVSLLASKTHPDPTC